MATTIGMGVKSKAPEKDNNEVEKLKAKIVELEEMKENLTVQNEQLKAEIAKLQRPVNS